MGRRSLKAQRREEILDAFEACVARYGMEGTTLERVAEFAGLGRPAIRHNVGNREALIDAALERIVERHEDAYCDLPQGVDPLLTYLFVGEFSGAPDAQDAVLDELFALRHRDAEIARRLDGIYREFQDVIAKELQKETGATVRACRSAAYVIMAMAYGASTFSGLGVGARRGREALAYARQIVAGLR